MSLLPPIQAHSSISSQKPSDIPRIIHAHFPPDHLISRDEVMKCHNSLQLDRSLLPHTKEMIQEHMEKVERDGLKMDVEVPAAEADAWNWVNPYLIKTEGEEEENG
jgi:hypothetical protein